MLFFSTKSAAASPGNSPKSQQQANGEGAPVNQPLILSSLLRRARRRMPELIHPKGQLWVVARDGVVQQSSILEQRDRYWISVLTLVNWVGNVLLPLYGTGQIVLAVVHFAGLLERMTIGEAWVRDLVAAMCCFGLSGLCRLGEFWIQHGTAGVIRRSKNATTSDTRESQLAECKCVPSCCLSWRIFLLCWALRRS